MQVTQESIELKYYYYNKKEEQVIIKYYFITKSFGCGVNLFALYAVLKSLYHNLDGKTLS